MTFTIYINISKIIKGCVVVRKLFIKPIQEQACKLTETTKKLIGVIDRSDENYIIQGIMNMLHKMNETFYIITRRQEYYVYGYASDNSGVKIVLDYNFTDVEEKPAQSNIEMSLYPSAENENDLLIAIESTNPEDTNKVEEFKNFCLQKLFIYEE